MDAASQDFLGIVSGERRRRHPDVADRTRRIAGGLHRLGVREGGRICMLMRNDIAFIEVAHAAIQLGAYAVPINWHFKPEEIKYTLKDSAASVLIGHADLLHQLNDAIPSSVKVLSVPAPPEIIVAYQVDPEHQAKPDFAIDFENWLAKQPHYSAAAVLEPMSMIYTSGTTGHPKGVRRAAPSLEQNAALERRRAMIYGNGTRALLPGPLYHSAPNFFAIRSSRIGGVLVLMPRFEPEELLRPIEAEKVDTILIVPTMFVRLMKLPDIVRKRYDLSSLRRVVSTAAPCAANVKRAVIEWWGPVIYEFYGSTESGAVTFATSQDALTKPGTVGKVLPEVELRVVGVDGCVLPIGQIGEIDVPPPNEASLNWNFPLMIP
ncbi:acyl-CoA synthetase (AMP-forming)/AMP-acid ligase II [Bradyrhizobium sp. USDA 3686]|nr:acyl-CoA synthetase (AMP-forming)/AMP-acid ligase II [Bradyrhizobium canariense]